MYNRGDDPAWKARWEEGFKAGYAAQQVDQPGFKPNAENDWLWPVVYELYRQYCLPQFVESSVLLGLQQTLAYLRQHELERPALEAEVKSLRQLSVALQNRLDDQNKPRQNNTAGR